MDNQTTIVGRPTYMTMFSGQQDPAPIVEKLTAIGYPLDDISILVRPPGGQAVVDLLAGENAAGQDTDASALLAQVRKHKGDEEICTIVLLHPEPGQVEAVRAVLTGMGAQEFEYEPETRFTGEDSESAFAAATFGSVNAQEVVGNAPANATPHAGESDSSAAAAGATSKTTAQAAPGGPAAPQPADASDLKAEIEGLKGQVDQVKQELEQRD